MNNLSTLLEYVNPINHFSIFGKNKVIVNQNYLSGREIYYLFEHIKWMELHNIKSKCTICLRCMAFRSSDVINVLEILMLYLASCFEKQFCIIFDRKKELNTNLLYINSLLHLYDGKFLDAEYCNAFHKDIYTPHHYRHVVCYDKVKELNTPELSIINDNIKYTIQNGHANYDLACEAAESVTEMIGNVVEHSKTSCLVDIKICRNIDGMLYVSLNVVSLSSIFIGTKLLNLIKENKNDFSGSQIVYRALPNHRELFDENYDPISFSFICSFQNTVSTREDVKNSGGTGFTTLIKNIHNKSFNKNYDSYILSGNNTLYLRNDYLKTDANGIIGFNDNNDFYGNKPNENILKKEKTTFPGTIFCVNLLTEYIEYENN